MLLGSDVGENTINWATAKRITEASNQRLSASRLRSGDLVMVRVGDPGTAAVIPREFDGCNCASMMVVRAHSSFDSDWLCYAMNSPLGRSRVAAVQYGTAQKQFNISDAVDYLYPVPPLHEQRAIAAALSDVDALLNGHDQLISKKRDLKQAAMQQLLTPPAAGQAGGTRLPGFSGEWQVKMIGEFTDCTAGGTPSTRISDYWGGSIRWMNSGELNVRRVDEVEGRITEAGLKNSSTTLVPPRCVLIGLAGQGKTRGTVAMNTVELCTNQSIAAIFPNEAFVPEYLYYNLDSRYEELRELSSGQGGRGGLNLTVIKALVVPFPSVGEQTAIAAVLSDMDADLAALEARREKTNALKQGMMQELLTGRTRLVIPVGEDVPV
jgi:type I restriction enzyme S subunit